MMCHHSMCVLPLMVLAHAMTPVLPSPVYDPCYDYTTLDEPWRATNNTAFGGYCDSLVYWRGWYRMLYHGQNIRMPEECTPSHACGTDGTLWMNGTHPQLQDGIVTRGICASYAGYCFYYSVPPIQVKACPGNYYVYQFVRPGACDLAYCADVNTISPTVSPTSATGQTTTVMPVLPSPVHDPCHDYTTLDEPWRATNNTYQGYYCDDQVSWRGWYRLLYHGQNIRMPEECTPPYACGTYGTLWMNGIHPQLQDGIVTREIGAGYTDNCFIHPVPPIQVKACPGNYYVYQFVRPGVCYLAYCADVNTISPTVSPTSATVQTTTVSANPCGDVHCIEDEVCGEVHGIYGCLCNKSNDRPIPESFGLVATCHNSSCWMSLSRCLLFEDGFPARALHLNDPACTGTVRDGRVEFHFNNDDQQCGTVLRANNTHFIYENSIQGTTYSAERLIISRQRQLNLQFVCEYPIKQNASMDMAIHTLTSVIHQKLPAAQGTYQVQMTPYKDAGFTQQFSGNVTGQAEQTLYIAVDLEGVDSRQLSSVLDSCWATPSNDSASSITWDLITHQCPNPEDGTVKVLRNGVSTSSRFSFRMFTFHGASSQVYLHCSLHLCPLEGNSCVPNCDHAVHQHRGRRSADYQDNITVGFGPLLPDKNTDVLDVLAPLPKRRSPHL